MLPGGPVVHLFFYRPPPYISSKWTEETISNIQMFLMIKYNYSWAIKIIYKNKIRTIIIDKKLFNTKNLILTYVFENKV